MSRSALSRILALVFALTAGFASPVSALAHGWAHDHDHETVGHAVVGVGQSSVEHVDHSPAAGVLDAEAADHSHQTVGEALTAKAAAQLLAVVSLHVILPSATVVAVVTPPRADASREPLSSLAHASPPRLRAPPPRLG